MTTDNPVKEKIAVSKNVQSKKEEKDPLRICPTGQHWVKEHLLHIPPSQKNPSGSITTRHAHCATNPHPYENKNILSYDEIKEMTKKHFETLRTSKMKVLKDFSHTNTFDKYTLGWRQYFNKVFHPAEPLDPNLIKALIASESSFNPKIDKVKNGVYARGLMQIRKETFDYLKGEHSELRDHVFIFTEEDLFDPSTNICAGIRWLFRKRELAKAALKREPTWEEVIMNFKGVLGRPNAPDMQPFYKLYNELRNKKNEFIP